MAKKYKRRKSRLDPYIDEIKEMLATGCTYQQIADAMSEHFENWMVTTNNIYSLVHNRNLRSLVTKGCRNNRIDIPHCDGCDKCILVLNTTKSAKVRVCVELKEIVSRSCATSPAECPKREINRSDAYVHGGNC